MNFPPQPWPTGTAELLEPRVRRVLAANPSPFTFTGTQTYLVGAGSDAGDSVAVIDPGPAEPDHLAALVAAIGPARVAAIVCTHTHRDHSPAAIPLAARTGAPIVGCAPLVLDDAGPRADASFDPDYAPDRVLRDGDQLSGSDWTLTAIATPGHTSNHLCYALGDAAGQPSGALFTGDHIMGWSTTVVAPPDGDMAAYMDSLQKIHDRDDRVHYPAHGPQIDNPRQFTRGLIGHRRQRERQILALLAEGPQTIAALVPRMYKGVAEALWLAAGRSVLAHLRDCENRGLVARNDDSWRLLVR